MSDALIEIDFQRWVLELAHRDIIPAAIALRHQLTGVGAHVFCTRYLERYGDAEAARGLRQSEADFHPAMRPRPGDVVITKYGKDIFTNPDLVANLEARGVTDVFLTGLLSDHGVDAATRSAIRLGYRTTLVPEACAGTSRTAHDQALTSLTDAGATCRTLG